jgi:rhodanese-related sulfurtransferase
VTPATVRFEERKHDGGFIENINYQNIPAMKRLKNSIVLIIISMVGYTLPGCSQSMNTKSHIAMDITVQQFTEMTAGNPGLILDVRTPGEVANGKIPESVNIDYYSENFLEEVSKLDKNKPVYIYCASGGRSGHAMEKFSEAGFKEVYNLAGGYNAWSAKTK